ncbi:hypothetical protein Leryth_020207 [Lithospermum erythrorhizon]|nr:hypothetical protein Leryth_020207 [Lithospermum erythrorhizon]
MKENRVAYPPDILKRHEKHINMWKEGKLSQEYMNKVVGEDGTGTSFARTPIPTSTTRDYTCGSSHVNEPSGEGRLFIHERYVVEAGVVSPSAADERG